MAETKVTDRQIDVTGDVVGTTESQTLTNKTLTSPTINTPTIDYGDSAPVIDPKCRVRRGSNQSISNNTWTKIQYDTETYDVGGDFDNSTNYRFTCPVAGYYLVISNMCISNPNNADYYNAIRKNNSNYSISTIHGHDGNTVTLELTDVIYCAANDYLEGFLYHNSGASRDVNTNTYFTVHLLST